MSKAMECQVSGAVIMWGRTSTGVVGEQVRHRFHRAHAAPMGLGRKRLAVCYSLPAGGVVGGRTSPEH